MDNNYEHDILQHRDTQETLAALDRLDLDNDKPSEEEIARKFGFEEEYYEGRDSLTFELLNILKH